MRRRQQRLFGEVVSVKCALLSVPTGELGDNSWVQLVPVGKRVHVTHSPCSFTLISSQEGGGGTGPEMTASGFLKWGIWEGCMAPWMGVALQVPAAPVATELPWRDRWQLCAYHFPSLAGQRPPKR